ncbi:hypothetical protein [Paenibacillus sp. FJAT-26967]|uniref:hypothetical protein n=1 Tax=Paenibacillus sp. FJAT-26967 TaxID=1729690 RepID=UPI000839A282|nr:hypothetical protein [Paenibacillus sp. FJAT-26967]
MSIERVYQEIGIHSPFAAARHLGIKIMHYEDLGDYAGFYNVSGEKTYRIMLNANIELELQDLACAQLVNRHLTHPGTQYILLTNEVKPLANKLHRLALIKLWNYKSQID